MKLELVVFAIRIHDEIGYTGHVTSLWKDVTGSNK